MRQIDSKASFSQRLDQTAWHQHSWNGHMGRHLKKASIPCPGRLVLLLRLFVHFHQGQEAKNALRMLKVAKGSLEELQSLTKRRKKLHSFTHLFPFFLSQVGGEVFSEEEPRDCHLRHHKRQRIESQVREQLFFRKSLWKTFHTQFLAHDSSSYFVCKAREEQHERMPCNVASKGKG